MNKRALSTIALLGATGALVAGGVAIGANNGDDQSAALAAKIDSSRPKNVILLIGDGMGDSEVTVGRYYGKGAAGRLNMDALPFRGSSLHYVLTPGPGPNYAPNYAGDSAPTATAWSTGKRTQDSRLSQAPSTEARVPGSNEGYRTYMEIARDAGKAVGNVTHVGDHRRDAGCSQLAHLPALLHGSRRRSRDVPDGDQGSRRPRLDRRAAGRPGLRRLPRRRPHQVRAETAHQRQHDGRRLRESERLRRTSPTEPASPGSRRWRAAERCSASSTRAT